MTNENQFKMNGRLLTVSQIINLLSKSALSAVHPEQAIERSIQISGDQLKVMGKCFPLTESQNITVVGGGKACLPMASALRKQLKGRISTGHIAVNHQNFVADVCLNPINISSGGHPIPDQQGIQGATKILNLAAGLKTNDILIALISGGASAILTLPVAGIELSDLRQTTELLLKHGADIRQINTVRKHLSAIKGGNLAKAAFPATVISLILSDVVGDPLEVIASGPTVGDPTTFLEAKTVLDDLGIWDKMPTTVSQYLSKGISNTVPETVFPNDPIFAVNYSCIIGSGKTAAVAAQNRAEKMGFNTEIKNTGLVGEAKVVARQIVQNAINTKRQKAPNTPPICQIYAGETTVRVNGNGLGGRNQELALSGAMELNGISNIYLATLATDGRDGPTDAAGALVDGNTAEQGKTVGLDPQSYLENNDAYSFLNKLGLLIKTGPTQTNVADLTFILIF